MGKSGIFVFTNDNSSAFKRLAEHLSPLKKDINIHIVDDSYKPIEIKKNKAIAKGISSGAYLGKEQCTGFYNNTESEISPSIGTKEWNLGKARNFALDYSKQNGYKKILFIDQDIRSFSLKDIETGFEALDDNSFMSFRLEGLTDDSLIGHLSLEYGLVDKDERMLSGGFLFIPPQTVRKKFMNVYNEDWIFQIQEDKKRITMPYKAYHDGSLPIKISLEKLLFQELGEVIVEGLFEDKEALSCDFIFWENIIGQRKQYISKIANLASEKKNPYIAGILATLLEKYDLIEYRLKNNILPINYNNEREQN